MEPKTATWNGPCIRTKRAPTPGAYSQGVRVNPLTHDLLFLAGQTANVPDGKDEAVIEGGLARQTVQALTNVLAIVEAAGGTVYDIVDVMVLLKEPEDKARQADFQAMNGAYIAFFAERGRTKDLNNLPARTMCWVSDVPWATENTMIEVKAVAQLLRDPPPA
jgi:2-iminobutanoate/2-iminopropanoate deaminase